MWSLYVAGVVEVFGGAERVFFVCNLDAPLGVEESEVSGLDVSVDGVDGAFAFTVWVDVFFKDNAFSGLYVSENMFAADALEFSFG